MPVVVGLVQKGTTLSLVLQVGTSFGSSLLKLCIVLQFSSLVPVFFQGVKTRTINLLIPANDGKNHWQVTLFSYQQNNLFLSNCTITVQYVKRLLPKLENLSYEKISHQKISKDKKNIGLHRPLLYSLCNLTKYSIETLCTLQFLILGARDIFQLASKKY